MEYLEKNKQYYKFCFYGFLKNLRFFDAFFMLFLVEKGVSFTQIGILYAAREIATNVLEIPSGILADTFGRKATLAGSFVLYIGSFALFYIFNNFWFFLLAFILFGVAESFRSGTHKGMIMDYLNLKGWEKHAVNYYGHTRSWSQMGSALSALLAGLIVFYGGDYQIIFLYSIVPYLINLFLILSYPGFLNQSMEQNEGRKRTRISISFRMLLDILKQNQVRRIIFSSATHSAFLKAVKDYIQLVMVNLALVIPLMNQFDPKQKNGFMIGVLYFFIFIGTSLASKFSSFLAAKSRHNIVQMTLISGFAAGAISGVSYHYNFWMISLLAFAGIYLVENIRKPILTGAVAKQVPKEILTSVISSQSLLSTIITSLLALIFGVIADHSGVGISLMSVSGLLLLITAFIQITDKSHS
ncbi:MAG: MFS transporter [Bacteroidales bacterium]